MDNIAQWIISAAALIAAVIALVGYYNKIHNWVQHQDEQDTRMTAIEADITESKEERMLIVFALSACLDGLQQLGANHTVPVAKDKLDKFINKKAHR